MYKALIFIFLFLLLSSTHALTHPGRPAADGCHYCRTHCERWGVSYNERHCHREPISPVMSSSPETLVQWRTVIRVVDGDTLFLEGGERIRLIGVDTPETVRPNTPVQYFGKEASSFTRRMCEGKKVRLEFDWEKKDKYGRTLAYVYLEDGTFLNAELIKQGYAHAYTRFPHKYLEEFRRYEREARENQRGLWQ